MEPSIADNTKVEDTPENINQFFFKQLVLLAANHEVKTTEDIFSSTGMKLVGKGTKVSQELYDRIISHKLTKPLESSVVVEGGITPKKIAEQAISMLDSNASISSFAGWTENNKSVTDILAELHFTPASQTLLSVYASKNPNTLQHITQVALLSLGLAHKMQAHARIMRALSYASIFHDVGELYINPDLMQKKNLLPNEWRQLAAHPIVGQTVLQKTEGIGEEISAIIGEHHERLDGFGYPLGKRTISIGGQILCVAETVSGLMNKRHLPLRHAELALKIVPGEYAAALINLISRARAESGEQTALITPDMLSQGDLEQQMHGLFMRLAQILGVYDLVEQAARHFSKPAQTLLNEIYDRFGAIQRAFSSTGLDSGGADGLISISHTDSNLVHFEAQLVVNEIQWRLGELSRELSLRCLRLPDIEAQSMLMLATALNGEKQNEIGNHSDENVSMF